MLYDIDCFDCDWRANKVPARDYPENSKRPIYLLTSNYPRQVRNDRGYTWSVKNLDDGIPLDSVVLDSDNDEVIDIDGIKGNHVPNTSVRVAWEAMLDKTIIGYIPQVSHTYAIFEGNNDIYIDLIYNLYVYLHGYCV